uniref:Dendritic cell-specific transmembrane protein n=1 Tax=Geotrypetes seraphini TaxID=260995 RepID=A0A6P8PJ92_GEOSA|nr:dendritic cell-specific transmembrane protein [Geotrypetes seraphini]
MIEFTEVMRLWLHLMDTFVSERKTGWKNIRTLLLVCCICGLILGSTLLLILYASETCTFFIASVISVAITFAMSSLLFYSKHVRCFSVLFLLSCGMREGRNALITAGTGIVIFHDIKNIFTNFRNLADSITCSLEAKRLSLQVTPLDHYIKTIQWIYNQSVFSRPFPDIVTLSNKVDVSASVSDEKLKLKLNKTELQIQGIVDDISSLLEATFYVGRRLIFVLSLAIVLIGTGVFLRRYLSKNGRKFDNIYITKHFIEFDERKRKEGKPCVLPLNKKEKHEYITIPTLHLSCKERKRVGLFFLPILMNLGLWALFMAIDFSLYWLIFSVKKHLENLPEQNIPWLISNFVKGTKSSFSASFKISLFEPDCMPTPVISLSKAWIPLSIIIVVLLILGMLSAALTQLQLLVSASFYPDKELERIHYLHSKVLKKRSKARTKNVEWKRNVMVTKFFNALAP